MLRNVSVLSHPGSSLRSLVALLLVFSVLAMSAASYFADQKLLLLTTIFFLVAIASAVVASRFPEWMKKNRDDRT